MIAEKRSFFFSLFPMLYMLTAFVAHLLSVLTGSSSIYDFQMMYGHKQDYFFAQPQTCAAALVHLVPLLWTPTQIALLTQAAPTC